jgi:hypothetical protein
MRVGINPFGSLSIHPLSLHTGIVMRHLGILTNPFQAIKPKQQEQEHHD